MSRPVVCLPDSGGAAYNIYQYVSGGGSFEGLALDPAEERTYAAARRCLPQIKHYGEVEVGANKEKQVRRPRGSSPCPSLLTTP